ncbi:MAG: capsid protein [Mesorhizobium sp.]|nr:capsid protein [Mesorhizobium sp.]
MTQITTHASATTPSRRTLHVELLRLCARIGYSPPAPV